MSNKGFRKIAGRGFMWLFATTLGQYILQLATLIILARLLTPSDFGLVSAATLVLGFLTMFTELGVGPALVQKSKINSDDIGTANIISLLVGLILSAFLFFSGGLISEFFRMPNLSEILTVFSIILPIMSIRIVAISLLQRNMKFKQIGLIEFWSYLFGYVLVTVPLAFFGWGVRALVYGHVCKTLISVTLSLIDTKSYQYYHFKKSSAFHLLNYGFGLSIAKLANYFANQGDNVVVGRYLGEEALGVYGRAYQLMALPAGLIGKSLDRVLFPIMSTIQHDNLRNKIIFERSLAVMNLVSIPLSSVIIVLADEIVEVVLGEKWQAVIFPLQIMTCILVFRMSYKLSDSLARAKGAVYRRAWRQFIYAALVIVGAYIGTSFGLTGVATAVSIAILLNFLLMLHLSHQLIDLDFKYIIVAHLKSLSLGVIVFFTAWFLKEYALNTLPVFIRLLLLITFSLLIVTTYLFIFRKLYAVELSLISPYLKSLIERLRPNIRPTE